MKGVVLGTWLRNLAIALIVLGFMRVPLPASPLKNFKSHAASGEFCPLGFSEADSLGTTCALHSTRNGAGAAASESSWQTILLSVANVGDSSECKENCEDFGCDGETSDVADGSFDSEDALPRSNSAGSILRSRGLALALDSMGLTADPHAPVKRSKPAWTSASCNGTSPSYGPSLQSLHQRWAC